MSVVFDATRLVAGSHARSVSRLQAHEYFSQGCADEADALRLVHCECGRALKVVALATWLQCRCGVSVRID